MNHTLRALFGAFNAGLIAGIITTALLFLCGANHHTIGRAAIWVAGGTAIMALPFLAIREYRGARR